MLSMSLKILNIILMRFKMKKKQPFEKKQKKQEKVHQW